MNVLQIVVCSAYTSKASPCVLFNVPDGHTKEMKTTGSKHKDKEARAAAVSSNLTVCVFRSQALGQLLL